MGGERVQDAVVTPRADDCKFCGIANGDIKALEIVRTPEVLAFFPDDPATLGHTLVVPVEHVCNIWELKSELGHELIDASREIAHAMRDVFDMDGLNMIQSNGEVATQTVFHLHIHLLPRTVGDAMGPIWPQNSDLPPVDVERSCQQLRRAMNKEK